MIAKNKSDEKKTSKGSNSSDSKLLNHTFIPLVDNAHPKSALLFIHGMQTNMHLWDKQVSFFKSLKIKAANTGEGEAIIDTIKSLLLFDLPGHGNSFKVDPNDFLFETTKHIIKLINHYGLESVTLLAHGFGGLIAVELARMLMQTSNLLNQYKSKYGEDYKKYIDVNILPVNVESLILTAPVLSKPSNSSKLVGDEENSAKQKERSIKSKNIISSVIKNVKTASSKVDSYLNVPILGKSSSFNYHSNYSNEELSKIYSSLLVYAERLYARGLKRINVNGQNNQSSSANLILPDDARVYIIIGENDPYVNAEVIEPRSAIIFGNTHLWGVTNPPFYKLKGADHMLMLNGWSDDFNSILSNILLSSHASNIMAALW